MSRATGLAVLFGFLVTSPVFAQQWAQKMFAETEHNFGQIPRGAKAEYEFVLTNNYVDDVHIVRVSSNCSCTTPRIKKNWLKTYEKGAIIAHFNTKSFLGKKGATITVHIDKPYPARVQLHVSGYIRSDVVFEPGSVQFGSVDQGQSADQKVSISYAGRGNWKILDVKSDSPYLSGEVVETGRNRGRKRYELVVHLDKDAPIGYLHDRLRLITNDGQTRQIPVLVEGVVLPEVTVSPASLFLGVVQPGQKVTKQLVIRGNKPFRILSIDCDDESFQFEMPGDEVAKPLYVVPVTFVAGADAGRLNKTIRIQTDLDEASPELAAYAVVSTP
jgi:hypothetical protein